MILPYRKPRECLLAPASPRISSTSPFCVSTAEARRGETIRGGRVTILPSGGKALQTAGLAVQMS